MKFLCTSDFHLGRCSSLPFDTPGLDVSAQGALNRLVETANQNKADWLLIAGDLSDADENYYASLNALREAFLALDDNIGVAMISGNHDEGTLKDIADKLRETPGLGDRIWYLNGKTEIGGGLYLLGCPYDSAAPDGAKETLLKECDSSTIVLFHGDHKNAGPKYSGLTGEERDTLARNSYFTVCGHNHYPDGSFFDPDSGARFINCGSPQALDAGDGGASGSVHGAWLIEGRDRLEFIPLSTVVYATERIDVNADPETAITEKEKELLADVDYKACVVADIVITGINKAGINMKDKLAGKNKKDESNEGNIIFGKTRIRTVMDESLPDVGMGDASPLTLLNSLLKTDDELAAGLGSDEEARRITELKNEIWENARKVIQDSSTLLSEYDADYSPEEMDDIIKEAIASLLNVSVKEKRI